MLRLLRWPAMVVLGLTLSACATMNVSSHVERGLDFAVSSWQWAPADALPASDVRLDNPFFQDHFQGAVEREFAMRGLVQTRTDADLPDLLVHYHANVAPKMSVNKGDQTIGACYDENCSVKVFENEVGTMMLDVIDAHTNRLIWRLGADIGRRRARSSETAGRPHSKAVKGMFATFPRSL